MAQLSNTDITALRERLSATDGGIKAASQLAGLSEAWAHKALGGGSCRSEALEAFIDAVGELEIREREAREKLSQKAQASPVPVVAA